MRYTISLDKSENFEDALRRIRCEYKGCNGLSTEVLVTLDGKEHCFCIKHWLPILDMLESIIDNAMEQYKIGVK